MAKRRRVHPLTDDADLWARKIAFHRPPPGLRRGRSRAGRPRPRAASFPYGRLGSARRPPRGLSSSAVPLTAAAGPGRTSLAPSSSGGACPLPPVPDPPATVPPRRRTCFAGRLRIVATNMSMPLVLDDLLHHQPAARIKRSHARLAACGHDLGHDNSAFFAIVVDGRDLPLEVFFIAHGRADVADGPGWSSFQT